MVIWTVETVSIFQERNSSGDSLSIINKTKMSSMSDESPDDELNSQETAGISQGSSRSPPGSTDTVHLKTIALQMPRIGKGLFISGVNGVTNKKILQQQNITHILNLAHELKDASFPEFVVVRCVGLRDSEDVDLLPWFPELVDYIHSIISNGGNICVNCVAGISRSASVCLAYKICHEDLSLRQAFEEVYKARPVISPNFGFMQALLQWEMAIRGENSVVMRPYICGMVPELESYTSYSEMRIKIGWMDELLAMWAFHFMLFVLQVIAIVWVTWCVYEHSTCYIYCTM